MIISLNVLGFELFTLAFGQVENGFEYLSNASLDTDLADDDEEPMAFGFQGANQ